MKVVIVGGGTAGWLTALYIEKIAPDFEITLVESDEIGILGAGEGSVPLFSKFLQVLGISEVEFIKETNATFKIGIHFQNWKKDKSSYFHPFVARDVNFLDTTTHPANQNPISVGLTDMDVNYVLINLIANNKNINDNFVTTRLAYNNKSPFVKIDEENVTTLNQYSYHFDAALLGKYLKKIANNRGVRRVEGKVTDFVKKDKKITEIKLENDKKITCDFVFDCTGFARKIIGQEFNTKWISYKDRLKVDSAIPFFLPIDEKITPYTHAIAMKYGWMWKIPLQNRYGCGYIFDSNYISFEEAQREVEEYLGQKIEIRKHIEFEAGRFEKFWVNNCISIGLSSGFTEPIEATAIWTIIHQLTHITKQGLLCDNEHFREEYNNAIAKFNDSVCDFLQFHYFTDKDDTDFWKTYTQSTTKSPSLQQKLKMWQMRTPNVHDNDAYAFHNSNWLLVGIGINDTIIPKELFIKENKMYNLDNIFKTWYNVYRKNLQNAVDGAMNHDDFIKLVLSK